MKYLAIALVAMMTSSVCFASPKKVDGKVTAANLLKVVLSDNSILTFVDKLDFENIAIAKSEDGWPKEYQFSFEVVNTNGNFDQPSLDLPPCSYRVNASVNRDKTYTITSSPVISCPENGMAR